MKIVSVVGGLGSQMMAFGLYLALKKAFPNDQVILDFSGYSKYGRADHNGAELHRIFGIEEQSAPSWVSYVMHGKSIVAKILRVLLPSFGILSIHRAKHSAYNYDPGVFVERPRVAYDQCWTSWKYFESVEHELRRALRFPLLSDSTNAQIAMSMKGQQSVAIHVRRGDYLQSPVLGGLVGRGYFEDAIHLMRSKINNPVFYIFSDDIEWCRNNLVHLLDQEPMFIDWNHASLSYIDMQLMSHCRHHIIPNSSFSWWGAYLAKHKEQIVIAPKFWVNPKSGLQMNDMNLPDWLIIDNSNASLEI